MFFGLRWYNKREKSEIIAVLHEHSPPTSGDLFVFDSLKWTKSPQRVWWYVKAQKNSKGLNQIVLALLSKEMGLLFLKVIMM